MQVEMIHNPYQGSLQILINGQSRPRLADYAYKSFSSWYRDIFNLLDGETNEPYHLRLTANWAEADIIKMLSTYTKYCKNVSVVPFPLHMPTENRVHGLEEISEKQYHVPVRFCVMPSLQSRISASNIHRFVQNKVFVNQLWNVQDECCDATSLSDNPLSCEYLFVLATTEKELTAQILASARRGYYSEICCVLLDGKEGAEWIGSNLSMHCQPAAWERTLHQLMECLIIGDCFRMVYQQIPEQYRSHSAFQVKQRTQVMIPDFIEQGGRAEIRVTPPSGNTPSVEVIIRNPSVLRAEGTLLIGTKEGSTNVQVFEQGTNQLLASGEVTVRFVPRIRELYPDDVGLRHGETLQLDVGDSRLISYQYGPQNAENVSEIRWSCDNLSVARVHSLGGRITALRAGFCTIRCEVKGIGFSVPVEVRPIPERIELPEIYGDEITLVVGENCMIRPAIVPANSHFGEIVLRSADPTVVRVVDQFQLHAESEGITQIIIEETLHDVQTSVTVQVWAAKKTGLLSRLFRK